MLQCRCKDGLGRDESAIRFHEAARQIQWVHSVQHLLSVMSSLASDYPV